MPPHKPPLQRTNTIITIPAPRTQTPHHLRASLRSSKPTPRPDSRERFHRRIIGPLTRSISRAPPRPPNEFPGVDLLSRFLRHTPHDQTRQPLFLTARADFDRDARFGRVGHADHGGDFAARDGLAVEFQRVGGG